MKDATHFKIVIVISICLFVFFFFFFFGALLCQLLTDSFLSSAIRHFRCLYGKVLHQPTILTQSALYPARYNSDNVWPGPRGI